MKTYFPPLFLACALFVTTLSMHAQQFIHVSPTGNDRNAGTKEAPLASLSAAMKVIRTSTEQEITLFLQNGIYHLEQPVILPDLLNEYGFQTQRIAVEINGAIIPKATYHQVTVTNDDTLEVVSFVGGG